MSSPDVHARHDLVGGVLVGLAALQFGVVVVLGKQALSHGLSVTAMLAVRFGIGALILAALLVALRRPLVAVSGERVGLTVLALCGYAVEASFFFTAAKHGTAAAVTLLFFTYPVFVALGTWLIGRRAPARPTLAALACAVAGAAVVAGTGAGLSIQPLGIVFALASAVTYTGYLIGADVVLERTNPMTSAMWVSGGASLGLLLFSVVSGAWRAPVGAAEWAPLLGMGAATAGAFVCLLSGLQRIGAVRTSIVSATEPLAAAVLGFVFLDETVGLGVAAGGVLILVGAVTASLARAATTQEQQIP